MVHRLALNHIFELLEGGKVIGLFGARRTGKTVLMKLLAEMAGNKNILTIQGDDLDASEILSSKRLSVLSNFVRGYDYLFIDEAQAIPSIGLNLKLLVDNFPGLRIFITGSASLDLRNKVGEPLTGRSVFLNFFPLTQTELAEDYLDARRNIEQRLVFGLYPQVYTAAQESDKTEVLLSIKNGYLLKDVLEMEGQKDSLFLLNLLRLLAFQIGNDVSYNELATALSAGVKTVKRYLWILEQCFIIFSLPGYSRNLRKEYSKTPRYYFWDNGIRNILISNVNPLHSRDDVGKLWENFCIAERLKMSSYKRRIVNHYFWRTYDKQEIDLIEEAGGKLYGYEFKWKQQKARMPKAFREAYPDSMYSVVTVDDFLGFVAGE